MTNRDAFPESWPARFETLIEHRARIDAELAAAENRVPRNVATELRRMRRLLARSNREIVAADRDVLSLFLPLLVDADDDPDSTTIAGAVEQYLSRWITTQDGGRSLLAALSYPIVLAAFAVAILILFCIAVVPVFDEMFSEFELELPLSTEALIGLSRTVIRYGWIILGIVVTAIIAIVALRGWRGQRGHNPWTTGLYKTIFGGPTSVWLLATHLQDLSIPALTKQQALSVVERLTETSWLRQIVANLRRDLTVNPGLGTLQLKRYGGGLIPSAMQEEDVSRRRQMLQTAAAMALDRRGRSARFAALIVGEVATMAIGIGAALIIISLFAPLVSLISGLSG